MVKRKSNTDMTAKIAHRIPEGISCVIGESMDENITQEQREAKQDELKSWLHGNTREKNIRVMIRKDDSTRSWFIVVRWRDHRHSTAVEFSDNPATKSVLKDGI